MVRRASDADMDAVLAFAAQIFADEQDIPKELNFIPADKQPQWWCMEQDGNSSAQRPFTVRAGSGTWAASRSRAGCADSTGEPFC